MGKRSQHVAPNRRGQWSVRRTGASRASRVFKARRDAVNYARGLVRKAGSVLYIHGRDGSIQQRDSYGPDPMSPSN
ncbi:MAG: DUF2188 domain-containing protein [bacterium]|nr:DUF2188 domain-containing protein [bacterium]